MKIKRRSYLIAIITVVSMVFMLGAMATPAPPSKDSGKLIALTFDDGPSDTSAWLLNELKLRNVHVTFFYCGDNVGKYAAVVERAAGDGNQVGNHSWDHPDFRLIDDNSVNQEILKTDEILNQATGQTNFLLRPPYGGINLHVLVCARRPLIKWSVDTYDWAIRSQGDLTRRVVRDAHDGAIILMHETVPSTARGVVDAIDILTKRGYRFVTVSELFQRKHIPLLAGNVYYAARGATVDSRGNAGDSFAYDEGKLTSHWAYPYIQNLEAKGIMEGMDATHFDPEQPMTRAMFAVALARMSDENDSGYPNNFRDIPNNTWYTDAVSWAAAKGLVVGDEQGNFAPNLYITKEEVCVILSRYAIGQGVNLPAGTTLTYADSTLINGWAVPAVTALTAAEVIDGRPSRLGKAFDPQKYTSRAEASAIISRFIQAMKAA